MDSRAQCLGFRGIFGTLVNVPELRLVQRAKPAFLTIEDNDVLVLPVYHAYSSIPQGLVDAVVLQMLAERQSLAFALAIAAQPPHQRLPAHRIWFRLSGELENRGSKRCLVRCECNHATRLLVRCPDDERDVENGPRHISALMAIDAARKAFPMIGRHHDRCVPQSPAVFQLGQEGTEGTVGGWMNSS